MIELLTDTVFLYIATAIALYMYSKTRLNLFLIGGIGLWMNGLLTVLGQFFGYKNMWIYTGAYTPIPFQIIFIIFVSLTYISSFLLVCKLIETKHEKMAYIIILLTMIPNILSVIYPIIYLYTGFVSTLILLIAYYWYKQIPKCVFDPFNCDNG